VDRILGANFIYNAYGKRIFTDGPPATTVPAKWLTGVQEEIAAIIEGAGLTLSGNDNTQLKQALALTNWWLPGLVIGHGYIETAAVQTSTAIVLYDDSIPQNFEGDEILSITYTPKKASSILFVEGGANIGAHTAGGSDIVLSLFRDAQVDAIRSVHQLLGATYMFDFYICVETIANTIIPTTFHMRVGQSVGYGLTMNGVDGSRKYGGATVTWMKVSEISA
jgi:hypothetical protein